MPFVNIRIVKEVIAADPAGKKADHRQESHGGHHGRHRARPTTTSGWFSRRSMRATGRSARPTSRRYERDRLEERQSPPEGAVGLGINASG